MRVYVRACVCMLSYHGGQVYSSATLPVLDDTLILSQPFS